MTDKINQSEPVEVVSKTLDATIENIDTVTAFMDEYLESHDCPMKAQMQLDIAMDELFSNIAHYAYPEGTVGQATVELGFFPEPAAVRIRFIDSGVPYDPLAKADPDVTLSAEERGIGGLGIFMVKKTMDDMCYSFEEGKNILTLTKLFGDAKKIKLDFLD